MSSKCFVPNCKNTVGVLFPEEPIQKKKWLESLKVKQVIPNSSSFVCLEHFEEADIISKDPVKVKDDALPTTGLVINNVKDAESKNKKLCDDAATNNEEIAEIQMKQEASSITINASDLKNETESSISPESRCKSKSDSHDKKSADNENDKKLTENKDDNELTVNEEGQELPGNEDNEAAKESNVKENEPKDVVVLDDTSEEKGICRLCGKVTDDGAKNIFEEKIENVLVSVAIMECIYPMEISSDDKLSKEICPTCLESINSYFTFRTVCLENDKKQRDIHGDIDQGISNFKAAYLSSRLKRKSESLGEYSGTCIGKKLRVHEVSTDSEDDYGDGGDSESLSDYLTKDDESTSKEKKLVLKHRPIVTSSSDIQKKFDKVEAELRRVLEGQLTEEQAEAENIIIHVEDDDEEESPEKVAITKLKLPIVIKPVERPKEAPHQAVSSTSKIKKAVKPLTVTKTKITLPKGINMKIMDSYKSNIGIFGVTPIVYVFGMEFCQIDGYLFEYRLCKGNVRFLRCVLPGCEAMAVQNRVRVVEFSDEATVKKPHNHKQPDKAERKKQMFYYVMRRKMQSDKSLNFKCVYDEVCKLDKNIKDLVPLRNVINEICRHQLSYKIPHISTFDEFFDQIEDDIFQKLHFTHNTAQFYQERFAADDDSKAIVFANADIIDQVSDSNLMYIDASFKIYTTEDFKYQLVTVLVWIDDSYYPILFTLVNKKTQEIYKKIFGYLHDTLAPKLRPNEIVTDYEANLYYALGETYLDSAIGGSVFYYTQNLYKKICALNLSRDLETNSYFRNIYHMLLMLPLLPVNTILDGLNNMEIQARDLGLTNLTRAIFDHVRTEWIMKVTPDLFCVHRLENRINENVIAPFKKLRDFIMLSKNKVQRHTTIVNVVEKLIELENFLQTTYSAPNKKSFARDLSSSQKKNVLKAWQYIESHPKININSFFCRVLGYIKCMENQLWIWGFYRYEGDDSDELINATNFSIVSNDVEVAADDEFTETDGEEDRGQVVMEGVIDENGGFVLQNGDVGEQEPRFENAYVRYVYKKDA